MELSTKPILPGSFVVVKDTNSIYRGYKGFVQRVTKKRAAVLFEGGNWDKLITFQLTNLEIVLNFDFTYCYKFFYQISSCICFCLFMGFAECR